MSRRKLSIGVAVICLLAVGISLVGFGLFRDPINYARIRSGMTEREVETIMGKPADRKYHPWDIVVFLQPPPDVDLEWEMVWEGEERLILVQFDTEGKMCGKGYIDKDVGKPNRGFLASLRRLLW
jgi:hypothetical protein